MCVPRKCPLYFIQENTFFFSGKERCFFWVVDMYVRTSIGERLYFLDDVCLWILVYYEMNWFVGKKRSGKDGEEAFFFVFVCVIFMIMSMMKKRRKKEMPYSACWSCVKVVGRKKEEEYYPTSLSLSFLSWSVLEFPFSSSNLYPFTHDTAIQ